MYLVYTPLAPESMATVILSDCSMQTRLKLFTELLQAIDYIHTEGLMHRDLKPANMAIVSRSPPHAMLIDFGHASWNTTSRNHYRGTLGYLAPEIMALKNAKIATAKGVPYDNKVDLWAFGLCGYQLFCSRKFWWPSDNSRIADIVDELSREPSDPGIPPVLQTVVEMLAVDPKKRISAAAALGKACFRDSMTDYTTLSVTMVDSSSAKKARVD